MFVLVLFLVWDFVYYGLLVSYDIGLVCGGFFVVIEDRYLFDWKGVLIL